MKIKEKVKKNMDGEYCAGVFDGDGSISIESQGSLRMKFSQSNEEWCNTFLEYFPYFHLSKQWRDQNKRVEFELRKAGSELEPLIDMMLKHSILKYDQLQLAKEYLKITDKKEKEKYRQKMKELKTYNGKHFDYTKLSLKYICGLFDAEGCINKDLSISICQKNDHILLKKIGEFFNNYSDIRSHKLYWKKSEAKNILLEFKKHCIYKLPQINYALEILETTDKIKKKELTEKLTNEKRVDYDTEQVYNKDKHKDFLRECFDKVIYNGREDLLKYKKFKELEETRIRDAVSVNKKVFITNNWKNLNLDIELEFCTSKNRKLPVFNYLRSRTSSIPFNGIFGKRVNVLVKDKNSGMYLGLLTIASDVKNLNIRDTELNLNKKDLQNVYAITCCVPLQPFGFNCNGGKLIAMLAFSKEIFEHIKKEYPSAPPKVLTTTSIHGKSIMYDRLKELKYIGNTKGTSSSAHLPKELIKECKDYNDIWKIGEQNQNNLQFLKQITNHLQIEKEKTDIIFKGEPRGYYLGYLFSTKFNNDYNVNELKTANQIYKYWKERWYTNRINNLCNTNRLKKEVVLLTKDMFKDHKPYIIPERKYIKEKLTDKMIKNILEYKNKPWTYKEITHHLNNKYSRNFSQSTICDIFNGKKRPENEDEEYNKLINKPRAKIINNSLSDDRIHFIQDSLEQTKTTNEIKIAFRKKFKGEVSDKEISHIRNEQMVPFTEKQTKPQKPRVSIDKYDIYIKRLTEDICNNICLNKGKIKSKDMQKQIKDVYNVVIKRDFISGVWKQIIDLPEKYKTLDSYKQMCNIVSKKLYTNKKFTEEENQYIKEYYNSGKSLKDCVKHFYKKYNKTISTTYISKL